MLIKEELKTFIDESRISGITDPEIRMSLIAQGWQEEDIEEALNEYSPGIAQSGLRSWSDSEDDARAVLSELLNTEIIGDLDSFDRSIESVDQGIHLYLKNNPHYLYAWAVFIIFLEAIIYYISRDVITLLYPLVLVPLGYYVVREAVQHEFMKQFAVRSGFSYEKEGEVDGLDGCVFEIGHSRQCKDIIRGRHGAYPITLFNYGYTSGYGRGSRSFAFTVFRLQFCTILPNILLWAHGHQFGEDLTEHIGNEARIELEGDMHKQFIFYAQKEYEIEALQVFTPEIIERLAGYSGSFSLEIAGSELYIYSRDTISNKAQLHELYGLTRYFIDKLGPRIARMRKGLEAMHEKHIYY